MSWETMTSWLAPIFVVLLGLLAGYVLHAVMMRRRMADEVREAQNKVAAARDEADHILREAKLAAREEVVRAMEAFEAEHAGRRRHLTVAEERLAALQADLDRRAALLEKKTAVVEAREAELARRMDELEGVRRRLDEARAETEARLSAVAHLSRSEARQILLDRLEQELVAERAAVIRRHQEELVRTTEARARETILAALERFAADQVNRATTCSISLPDDEMKGRIIGREGRNIRSLEAETGCTFIVDDTARTLVISSFDPVRREVARRTVEVLIDDGRIQPARIEEVAARARQEVEEIGRKAALDALDELQLSGVDPGLLPLLGTLHFRTSFSQNVLRHSVEMGHLMGLMAADLGLDAAIARRVGLFHDIGKALSHKSEGPHAAVGADVLRRHGEPQVVWEAVAAHHHEIVTDNPYASLAVAADGMTAARPGARSETTELFLRRIGRLEQIGASFPGVKQCFALQAGRELRVFVAPEQVDDNAALVLARDIARRIHAEMPVGGQIKVTVIRETRCVEYVH